MATTQADPPPSRGRWERVLDVSVGPFGGTVAVVFIAVGLLVIALGWNGAAGSGGEVNGIPDIRAQIPWLISGGALGLALVVVGAALMVTQAHRADRARLEAQLQELNDALRGSGPAGAPARTAPSAPVTARSAGADQGLVVAGASSYHSPGCRLVEGREDLERLSPAEAAGRGLKPCRICKPA